MNECNCNQNHGSGVISNFCVSRNCGATGKCGLFKTEVLPVGAGTDAKGEPMAPKFGAYANTIVQYLANGAVYFYDSKGIYTKIVENGEFIQIINQLDAEIIARKNADEQLQQAIAQTAELLQTNINQLANKEAGDVENLQTNINEEVNKRTAENATLLKAIQDENLRAFKAEEGLAIDLKGKQDILVGEGEGQNLKTINGESLLGEGNIEISNEGVVALPTVSYTADNLELNYGDEKIEFTPAIGTAGGANSKAGIMSAFQATQLAALAQAYEAEEKGTVLYEGSASVNNIELSESGLSYDHLIIVAQYMGMGSFALEQQVSTVFYPTDSVKAFQMNANDISTGNSPMVQLIQDIWSITEDGMEIELVSALKATVNSETTVEPDTTSHFTITKVVGFGKKLVES